ncbi:Uncharacterised protein [Acinetobacter baumannii]|nr:Uncharacterised protein [Acinetobacter baumannii]
MQANHLTLLKQLPDMNELVHRHNHPKVHKYRLLLLYHAPKLVRASHFLVVFLSVIK